MARFLVEPRNVDQLAQKIESLLDWREREPELEEQCVEWEGTHFPFAAHVDAIEQILVDHRRRRRI
jgi:hypothetical protein